MTSILCSTAIPSVVADAVVTVDDGLYVFIADDGNAAGVVSTSSGAERQNAHDYKVLMDISLKGR